MSEKLFFFCAIAAVLVPAHVLLKIPVEPSPAAQRSLFLRFAVLLAIAPLTGALLMVIILMMGKGMDQWVLAPFALAFAAYAYGAWSILATVVSAAAWFGLRIAIRPKVAVVGLLAGSVWAASLVFAVPGAYD